LKIHQRTVIRWRDKDTDPAATFWGDLDKLVMEAAGKLAPWLHIDQLSKMDRRELLAILAASMAIPLAAWICFGESLCVHEWHHEAKSTPTAGIDCG
jgi:hypothetical protein